MADASSTDLDLPWVEKYRPLSLRGIIGQSDTVKTLNEFVLKRSFPHFVFAGPAGTGKTSTALALIRDLLGTPQIPSDQLLERNASDESRMRDLPIIKDFATHAGISDRGGFKFIILDEADNISSEVQSAFRRIIETAPANVRFIFLCNFIERIIDPILSRCAIFRFTPLPKSSFTQALHEIAQKEHVSLTNSLLDAIYFISQGDLRHAINLFQMSVALLQVDETSVYLTERHVNLIYEISGFLPPQAFKVIYTMLSKYDLLALHNSLAQFRSLSSRGFIRQLSAHLLTAHISSPVLEKLMITLAEYDYRLTLEADFQLQLDGFLAEIIQKLKTPPN